MHKGGSCPKGGGLPFYSILAQTAGAMPLTLCLSGARGGLFSGIQVFVSLLVRRKEMRE